MKDLQFIAQMLSNLGVIGVGLGLWEKVNNEILFSGIIFCILAIYLNEEK